MWLLQALQVLFFLPCTFSWKCWLETNNIKTVTTCSPQDRCATLSLTGEKYGRSTEVTVRSCATNAECSNACSATIYEVRRLDPFITVTNCKIDCFDGDLSNHAGLLKESWKTIFVAICIVYLFYRTAI